MRLTEPHPLGRAILKGGRDSTWSPLQPHPPSRPLRPVSDERNRISAIATRQSQRDGLTVPPLPPYSEAFCHCSAHPHPF